MKGYALLAGVLALAMLILPATAVPRGNPAPTGQPEKEAKAETIAVMATATGKVTRMEMREYLTGVLAAELSPETHPEAVKAQAVAAYTYALYVRNRNRQKQDSSLRGADISDSPAACQGYFTPENRKEKWGRDFEENEKKFTQAVDAVYGWVITYEGMPILAAYFDTCNGRTQAAKNLWGGGFPYLQSVASPGDRLNPALVDAATFSFAEFRTAAEKTEGVVLGDDPEEWVEKPVNNEDGYVKSLTVGGKTFTGAMARRAFGLKSTAFTVTVNDTGVVFRTEGSGHGVGMSQYGADYMARQGSTWEEILQHYYTDIEIEYP